MQAAVWGIVALAAVLFATSGLVRGTEATSTAQTTNPSNTFAMAALYAPTGLTGNPSGHDVALSWTAGQNGNGYAVKNVANGTSSDCSAVTFSSLGTSTGTSYTDAGRYTPQGTYYCYQIQTTYGSWTSVQNNPSVAVQIGFVATSIQMINAGNTSGCSGSGSQLSGQAGTLDCGDQLVVNFNQAVSTASGPTGSNRVCTRQSNNTIWLGSTTTTGTCGTNETVNLGKLTGGTIGGCNCRFQATYTWSNGNRTLTATIGSRVAGTVYPTVSTATWTLTPTTTATKMLSSTGGFHICDTNTGGGNCLRATASPSSF